MDEFVEGITQLLKLDPETATRLAELLEDRMKEVIDEKLSDHCDTYDHTFKSRY